MKGSRVLMSMVIVFAVYFFIPVPSQGGETLAVLDIVTREGIQDDTATAVAEAIRQEAAKSGNYQVLGSEEMAARAGAGAKSDRGCMDTQCMIEIGRAIDASYVIGGTLENEGGECYIKLRMVETRGDDAGVKNSNGKKCGDDVTVTAKMITAVFMGREWSDVVKEYRKETPVVEEPPHDTVWKEPGTGMEFVWVEGGCFQMGCGDWTGDCEEDEQPVREVCVDGFWMGKYEVTQGQWLKIMGDNPSKNQKGDDYPVEQITYEDIDDYTAKLNAAVRSGNTFRLPTEAEWEYAARSGGKPEKFAGGNSADDLGWHIENSNRESQTVGTKKPNGLGLHDMSGNVYEFCFDWYDEKYYQSGPKQNPKGPVSGKRRIIKGGSVNSLPKNLRTANRGRTYPTCPNNGVGFRLVWAPK